MAVYVGHNNGEYFQSTCKVSEMKIKQDMKFIIHNFPHDVKLVFQNYVIIQKYQLLSKY